MNRVLAVSTHAQSKVNFEFGAAINEHPIQLVRRVHLLKQHRRDEGEVTMKSIFKCIARTYDAMNCE